MSRDRLMKGLEYQAFLNSQLPNFLRESAHLSSYAQFFGAVDEKGEVNLLGREKYNSLLDSVAFVARVTKYGLEPKEIPKGSRDSQQDIMSHLIEGDVRYLAKKCKLSEPVVERSIGAMARIVNITVGEITSKAASYEPTPQNSSRLS